MTDNKKPLEMQNIDWSSWLKVASGVDTPENRKKWPKYRNRGGSGPCDYCGEDSPWFICANCGKLTCRSHHHADFARGGPPIKYCIMCKPSRFHTNTRDKP